MMPVRRTRLSALVDRAGHAHAPQHDGDTSREPPRPRHDPEVATQRQKRMIKKRRNRAEQRPPSSDQEKIPASRLRVQVCGGAVNAVEMGVCTSGGVGVARWEVAKERSNKLGRGRAGGRVRGCFEGRFRCGREKRKEGGKRRRGEWVGVTVPL